jgi:hypothetical protein
MLLSLGKDLGCATSHSIMWHSTIQTALEQILPKYPDPILGDLHPSLFNKDILAQEIHTVWTMAFPNGMDIEGCSIPNPLEIY